MRKITRDSVQAFLAGRPFSRENMTVTVSDGQVFLKLHGNTIAMDNGKERFITSANWETPTTKERLNGVLHYLNAGHIYQENWQWYLNGEPWDGRLTKIHG